MGIEDFFIREYEKVRAENEQLRMELAESRACSDGYGVFVRETSAKAVKVSVRSKYDMFKSQYYQSKVIDWDADRIRKFIRDDNLNEALNLNLITVARKVFPAVVEMRDISGSTLVYVDYDDAYRIPYLSWPYNDEYAPDSNEWIPEKYEDRALLYALDELMESMNERLCELDG